MCTPHRLSLLAWHCGPSASSLSRASAGGSTEERARCGGGGGLNRATPVSTVRTRAAYRVRRGMGRSHRCTTAHRLHAGETTRGATRPSLLGQHAGRRRRREARAYLRWAGAGGAGDHPAARERLLSALAHQRALGHARLDRVDQVALVAPRRHPNRSRQGSGPGRPEPKK